MNTNQTNTHETLRDDLKAFLDHELTWWRKMQVRRHMAGCAECRAELQDMTNISQKLQAENAASDEAAFDDRLRARILGDAPAADRTFEVVATSPAPRYRPRVRDWAMLGGVMSVLFIAFLSTSGKKTPTVFNVSNKAWTTGTEEGDRAVLAGRPGPAAAPARSAGDNASSDALRERNFGFADGHLKSFDKERDVRHLEGAPPMAEDFKSTVRSPTNALPGEATPEIDTTRRVHKEASIGVAVKSAEVASDAVVKLVQGAGGFIANNTLTSGGGDSKSAAMEIRVPVGSFDSILRQIGQLGEVRSKNISGEDKTEQFSNADQARRILTEDLEIKEAQLRAAQQRAARKKKTYVPGWEERQELRNLRIQAAQAKARMEILRKQTDLSSISVQLMEKATPPGEAGFWQSLNSTKMDAAKSFVDAAKIPLACLIWVLAYSPLWLPALLIWKYLNRTPKNAG